jgi:hypothetical protein
MPHILNSQILCHSYYCEQSYVDNIFTNDDNNTGAKREKKSQYIDDNEVHSRTLTHK